MSVDAASFKARYQEFAQADDPLVTATITDAQAQVSASVYGALYDQAVMLRTAHMLALSPFGLGLQLGVRRNPERADTSDVGSTVYEEQFIRLKRSVCIGALCAGT